MVLEEEKLKQKRNPNRFIDVVQSGTNILGLGYPE